MRQMDLEKVTLGDLLQVIVRQIVTEVRRQEAAERRALGEVTHQASQEVSVPNPETQLHTVAQVATILGISRDRVFGLLPTGELRSIKIGQRGRWVSSAHIAEYLADLE